MIGNYIPNIRKVSKWIWVARILILILLLLNFSFIWHNSAKISRESDKSSKKIASDIAPIVVDGYEELPTSEQKKHVSNLNGKIRSFAHFAEFVPLGFLLFVLALVLFDFKNRKLYWKPIWCTLFSLVITLVVALCDELHQLSVKGRTFQACDILFDTSGALIGCVLALIPIFIANIKKNKTVV